MLNALQLVHDFVHFPHQERFGLAKPVHSVSEKVTTSWGKLRLVFQCTWRIHYRFNADSNKWESHNQSFPHVYSLLWKFLSPFYFYWNLVLSWVHSASSALSRPLPQPSITKPGDGNVVFFASNCSFRDTTLSFSLPMTHPHSQLITMLPSSLRRCKQLQNRSHVLALLYLNYPQHLYTYTLVILLSLLQHGNTFYTVWTIRL